MSMLRNFSHSLTRRALVAGATAAGVLAALSARADTSEDPKDAEKKKSTKKVLPLSEKHQQALRDIPLDPPPKNLIQDQHFLVSDEHHPERLEDEMRDIGGVYIGTGPEQNYLYAAWVKPDIIILLDFDQMVVDIHELYRIFILEADSAEAMVKLWRKVEKERTIALIRSRVSDEARREHLVKVYVQSMRPIYNRLNSLRVRYNAMKLDTFLSDQAHYDFIRQMLQAGRVRAVRGDFTKDKAMNGVAKAANTIGVKVRALYLSNVEQYFDYDDGLRKNVEAQPTDGASKIFRTMYKGETKYERYHYIVQRDADFRAWLKTDVKNVREMMERAFKRIKKTKKAWILPGPA